jgi:hypothetical protein
MCWLDRKRSERAVANYRTTVAGATVAGDAGGSVYFLARNSVMVSFGASVRGDET